MRGGEAMILPVQCQWAARSDDWPRSPRFSSLEESASALVLLTEDDKSDTGQWSGDVLRWQRTTVSWEIPRTKESQC